MIIGNAESKRVCESREQEVWGHNPLHGYFIHACVLRLNNVCIDFKHIS